MSSRSARLWGEHRGSFMMRMISGHVEAVVNRPHIPPSIRVRSRTSLGTYLTECVLGERTSISRGLEPVRLEDIRPGEFVVATLRVHAGWLEAERIDIVKLSADSPIGISKTGAQERR
jgi:hypothetical protein